MRTLSVVILSVLFLSFGMGANDEQHVCKWFFVLKSGDTINCMTADSIKQGKWFEEYTTREGYFYEVGEYYDNRKEGIWKKYNNSDEKIESNIYLKGMKNGESKIFSKGRLTAIGNYRGYFYNNHKDTIFVENPEDFSLDKVEVQYEKESERNGDWVFLDEFNGDTLSKIYYVLGDPIEVVNFTTKKNSKLDSIQLSKDLLHPQKVNKSNKPFFPTR